MSKRTNTRNPIEQHWHEQHIRQRKAARRYEIIGSSMVFIFVFVVFILLSLGGAML